MDKIMDADGEVVTPQRLIAWLEAKYSRHGEEEDKWAADYIRATSGMKVEKWPSLAALHVHDPFTGGAKRLDEYDRVEWFDVARRMFPGLSDAEYDAMWNRFQEAKAAHERQKELQ